MKRTIKLGWMSALALLTMLIVMNPCMAEPPVPVPEPPTIPPALISGEALEPDVTIIERKDATIREYRVNGVLYMVRIEPNTGPAYYLVDRNGDGELDFRSNDPREPGVPQWILLRW